MIYRTMSTFQVKTVTNKLRSLAMGDLATEFLNYLVVEAGLAQNTVLAYGRDLAGFLEFCQLRKVSDIRNLQPEVIYAYQVSLAKAAVGESTIKRALVAIRMLLRYAKLIEIVDDDFSSFLETPKLWQRLPIVCSKSKVMHLLMAPQPEDPYYWRDRALLELLYATGIRAAEAASLQVGNINTDIGYMRAFGKGSKERIIPVGQAAINAVLDYLNKLRAKLEKPFSDDYLFLSRTGRPMSRIEIWRLVKKYAARAGLPKNMTVHTIRHCFATHLLSGGADLRSVQEMLGHVDIATTQIYTHVDQDRLRSIHKQYHPRP